MGLKKERSRSAIAFAIGTLWLVAGAVMVVMHDVHVRIIISVLLVGGLCAFTGGNERILQGSKWLWITRLIVVLLLWAVISSALHG